MANVVIHLPLPIHARLAAYAKSQRRSISGQVAFWLEEILENLDDPPQSTAIRSATITGLEKT